MPQPRFGIGYYVTAVCAGVAGGFLGFMFCFSQAPDDPDPDLPPPWFDTGAGFDSILGSAGDDNLDGGTQDDSIRGDAGRDTCTSGEVRMSSCEVIV